VKLITKMHRVFICLWLCLAGCVFAFGQQTSAQADSASKIIGTWEGAVDAGTARIKLVLHITGAKDGSLSGTIDVPEQGATALAIDSISVSDSTLHFEMKSLASLYEGKVAKDFSHINGVWKQAGQALPLDFKRAESNATEGLLKLEKIDAGGHALNMLIGGAGTPAVIFEGGFGAGIASWSSVQKDIAGFTRTASYDRAGLNQSELGPKPRSAKQIALELHAALQKAGIAPPYVFVGHSFGGIYVRVFADMYPKEVAGMVLIDPSQEAFEDWAKTHEEAKRTDLDEQFAKASQGVRDESAEVGRSYEQARAAKVPAGVPVILLSAMRDDTMPEAVRKIWVARHEEWIAKVPGGKHVIAENSGHFIQAEQPQLVIDTIRQVVDQWRLSKH
jgi:pimeloyl-ACP methyl ester carboxylesterase